ncbi:hypothetical protein [Streptomyces lavendulae]|uniref:hypothetical protein n=1 Tax=Streptomyces lavendulae TaxID=1914 RepID=UPI0031E9FA22
MTTNPPLRDRAIDALGQALNAVGYWLPVDGRPTAVDAVLALTAADLEASERRAVTLVERIGDARNWARENLPPEQQLALLAILRGSRPKETP